MVAISIIMSTLSIFQIETSFDVQMFLSKMFRQQGKVARIFLFTRCSERFYNGCTSACRAECPVYTLPPLFNMANTISYQPAPVVAPAVTPMPTNVPSYAQPPASTVVTQTKLVPPSVPSNNPKPASKSTQRIHDGLKGVAATTGKIADRILTHPTKMKTEIEMAQKVHTQYGEIIRTAAMLCEESEKLQGAVSEIQKTKDWLGDQCGGTQNTAINNFGAGMQTFNSFQALYVSQEQ